tara:strand:- start:30 stop:620 length:591 start_codon:yes stop_codon:yes gene_type:complete
MRVFVMHFPIEFATHFSMDDYRRKSVWTIVPNNVARCLTTLVVVLLSTNTSVAHDATRSKRDIFPPGEKMTHHHHHHHREEGKDFVVDAVFVDPFRANACLDAELYCEQTVRPAVEQDAKLREFLRDARKDAKTMNSWETIVPEDRFEALKTPETLAIGTRETKRLKRFFRRTPFCTTRFIFSNTNRAVHQHRVFF